MNILLVKIYYHLINSFGKSFKKKKKIKTIEDQGQKQVDALKNSKLKDQVKPVEDNQSKATITFDDLINKRKKNNERIT